MDELEKKFPHLRRDVDGVLVSECDEALDSGGPDARAEMAQRGYEWDVETCQYIAAPGYYLDEWGIARTRANPIVVRNMAESLAEAPDEPDWLWEGFIARGWLTLLVGPPKAGKTTLLCGLLDAFTSGQTFLGQPATPAKVLVLTEQSRDVLAETFRNFDLEIPADADVMHYREQPLVDWPEMIEQSIDYASRNGVDLLVVDTWARWAAMENDHDATEILRTTAPLLRAAGNGLAILIVHHSRKAGGEHGEEVAGRVEVAASVDVILSLKRAEENRRLLGEGRTMATPPELVFHVDKDGFELIESDRDADLQKVKDALLAREQATYEELANDTALPRTTVRRLLAALGARQVGKRGRAVVVAL